MKKRYKKAKEEPADAGPDRIIAIHRPAPGALRMRRPLTRSGMRVRVKVASWKLQRAVHAESIDESVAVTLLDGDPKVARFSEQPCLIEFVLDGCARKHYPDLEVVFTGGQKEIWEIKPDRFSNDPFIRRRTDFLTRELLEHGYRYRLVVSSELQEDSRLPAIQQLLRWGRAPVDLRDYEAIRCECQQPEPLTLGRFKQPTGPFTRGNAYRLALEGQLQIDLSQPLSDGTLVRLIDAGH